MDEFVGINWNPALEDILITTFLDDARHERESVMYRIMRGSFVDPFADIHEDYVDKVSPEDVINKKNEKPKAKAKAKQAASKVVPVEEPPQLRSYVPGIVKKTLHFPRLSSLNAEEHALCLRVLLRFSGSEKPAMTAADKDDLQKYMALKPRISKEQEEFLEFVKSQWDPTQLKIYEEEFINQQWMKKIKMIETLPRYYTEIETIPFVISSEIGINFHSTCLQLGILPRVILPKFGRRIILHRNTTKINQRYFSTNANSEAQKNVLFKTVVSEDPNCDKLANEHEVDLVISSSGLNCLALNMNPHNTNSWILPVVVKRINDKNVVFVDKPLPPTGRTVLQKNAWIFKYFLKTTIIHPKHNTAFKLDDETEENIINRSNLQHWDSAESIRSEKGLEKSDELMQIEETPAFDSSNTDGVDDSQDSEKIEENQDSFVQPPVDHNVFYNLFSIGSCGEPKNELMKDRVEKTYRLLVRVKIDGVTISRDGHQEFAMVAPKLEHQLAIGAEAVTIEEAAKQWMSLTFRPNVTLTRFRIDPTSAELLQTEKRTAISINNEIKRLHNLKSETALAILYKVADTMTSMNPGRYLIRHTVRSGAFASVYKEVDGPGKTVFDLQTVYGENQFCTFPNPPWPQLDTAVATPAQKFFKRMPALFFPSWTKRFPVAKGKKGRPKKNMNQGKLPLLGAQKKRHRKNESRMSDNIECHTYIGKSKGTITKGIMVVVEQYFRSGVLVYIWSKYLWQQILERRQRNIFCAFKTAPVEIREIVHDEQYETHRTAAVYRSGFEILKGTLNVGLATVFILLHGFRKLWDKSIGIVAYFEIHDSYDIMKNSVFLTMISSGTFLVSLPFALFDIHVRQTQTEHRITVTNVLLGHCIAQTLLFPFVCLFITAFKFGGDKTLLWVFGFAEFQLLTDFLLENVVSPMPPCELRTKLEHSAEKHKFPLKQVFIVKRLNGRKQVCLRCFPRSESFVLREDLLRVDSTTMERNLTVDEINALVIREISHWKRGHPYINFVVNQTHLCLHLYTMHRLLNSQDMFYAFGFDNKPLAVGLTLLQYCPLFDLYNFIARIVNRQLEFVADEDVKQIHEDVHLKKAILKTADHEKSFPVQDPLYSTFCNSEASSYERIIAINNYNISH